MTKEYKMTQEQLNEILNACKPTPVMYLPDGQSMFKSPQENANYAWKKLGEVLKFDHTSVKPIPGKSQKYFTAKEVN